MQVLLNELPNPPHREGQQVLRVRDSDGKMAPAMFSRIRGLRQTSVRGFAVSKIVAVNRCRKKREEKSALDVLLIKLANVPHFEGQEVLRVRDGAY